MFAYHYKMNHFKKLIHPGKERGAGTVTPTRAFRSDTHILGKLGVLLLAFSVAAPSMALAASGVNAEERAAYQRSVMIDRSASSNPQPNITDPVALAPQSYQFTFCSDTGTTAEARGYITYDLDLLSNPFSGGFLIPGPEILDLSVTVTGAASGNGTFTLIDFNSTAWNSNGAVMDLGKELVGQPTPGSPWGTTPSAGEAGDFNLFGLGGGAPTGVFFFQLAANEGLADTMVLRSMVPGSASNGTVSCDKENELKNISTRADVATGDEIAIAGFIIEGDTPKCVVVRGRGQSVNVPDGVTRLPDPVLTLKSGPVVVAVQDDWQFQDDPADVQTITDLGLAPGHPLDSAMYECLEPGAYTALLRGYLGVTGVGIIEVNDVDEGLPYLRNISTRARVGTGDLITIAGIIIGGDAPREVMIRGRGPTVNVPGGVLRLSDPYIRLFDSVGLIDENDDWMTAPNTDDIISTGLAPVNGLESAILTTLLPGAYTVRLFGFGGATGAGIVEVNDLTGRSTLPRDCVEANGMTWCYNDAACGEACNAVCAAKGLTPVANSTAWFEAQNTVEECQVIADALGGGLVPTIGGFAYGCLEDSFGTHSIGGGLAGPNLFCSTASTCPDAHRTDMDQLGVACGADSRRSICPCE
jgi:hypothetical protein